MTAYILRRILYAVPIVLCVNALTFALFFVVYSPDKMAEQALGGKHVSQDDIQKWKQKRGYDLPRFWNAEVEGAEKFTETIFWTKSLPLFWFDFGRSDNDVRIGYEIQRRIAPSLALTVPIFAASLIVNIVIAMIVAYCRGTYLDYWTVFLCVLGMSVATLYYIIGGQWVMGKILRLFPVSGFDYHPLLAVKFLLMPVLIAVVAAIGSGVRFYRTLFLEEVSKDYVRTARAKGLSEEKVLFKHALKNAMIPILTGVVVQLPFLFTGSLLLEAFFGIPGLGGFTYYAIQQMDFAIVRCMVFLGSVLYVIALLMTDISYTLVDPRVRLG